MQKLSKRLQAVADFVSFGSRIADIGTDHGYLPIYLVQSGRCPQAVAMDVKNGPLERAREHIIENRLETVIETRLSDGLQQLAPGDADSVVIAGMGGLTVIKILDEAAGLLPHVRELILEPQSDLAKVRGFLRAHCMHIDREELVLEDSKYYPVLHVVPQSPAPDPDSACRRRDLQEQFSDAGLMWQMLDQYGEYLVLHRHPVLMELLERDERLKQEILRSIENSLPQEKHAKRRRELKRQLCGIQTLQAAMRMKQE